MLETLRIGNIVLIESLDLAFGPGLNVMTGETGAGKSIMLDALGFALGRIGASGLVRAGADEGRVEAVFRPAPGHKAFSLLEEAGLETGDDGLILRRVASAAGPSRAFVNDQRVNAATLASIGASLVEVHGQHDDQGLLNTRGHRALLDAFAGAEKPLAACRAAYRASVEAQEAREQAEAALEAAARDRDFLEHSVKELRAFGPEAGEDEALDTRRRAMQAAERTGGEVAAAAALLGAEGAEGAAHDAMRRLSAAAPETGGLLEEAVSALDRALDALSTALAGVEAAAEALDYDPAEMERVTERLFALRALARKHGCAPDDLAALSDEMERRLTSIDDGEGALSGLRRAEREAKEAHIAAARALSDLRRKAAAALDEAVMKELPSLKMERAVFSTKVEDITPGPEGADQVTFLIAANPGAPPGDLGRVASGGELSRLLLALRVALSARGSTGVMIFDEIDRGVGGATANAVGRRLSRLAADAQVLVVTHSPQVAAFGDTHFRIEKTTEAGETRTNLREMTGDERRDEIARMLSGDAVTPEARQAAAALIKDAG